ncbi:hypothetical protein HCC61_08085 [Streptomyces sp. HNM0575]|nr:hypothetical protein [Streptomyces sp. HNM0575]
MTIYAQHANRGKTQILATYEGEAGVVAATVTSLGDPALTAPIVDALNQISALATVPVSVHDRRERPGGYYPAKHLAALTDRTARAELLNGAHSLWYEYACLELHQALADLDTALAAVPEPVRIAVEAELETEARQLREALDEFSEDTPLPEHQDRRRWDFEAPFVTPDGRTDDVLSSATREQLDHIERGLTAQERERAVADLRVIGMAYAQCSGEAEARIHHDYGEGIFAEPYDSDGLFVSIDVPKPGGEGNTSWTIEVGLWEPDDPDEEELSSATGATIRRCVLPTAPGVDELVAFLNRIADQPDVLAKWAETPIGQALAGTDFVVTQGREE